MSLADEDDPSDDRLAFWLGDYDDALAAGGRPPLPDETEIPPDLLDRFRRDRDILDVLNHIWPRDGSRAGAADGEVLLPLTLDPDGGATAPITGEARPAPPSSRLTSFRLPGFLILEKVGQGGMGIVFRAIQLSLNREVAVKVLPPHLALDPTRLRRFRNEAVVAAGLTDSCILPVIDACEVDGVPIMVMPFVEGRDLGRVISDRRAALRGEPDDAGVRLPWTTLDDETYLRNVLDVLDRVVETVAVLHTAGVLHRDLKPSNILVDRRGKVWLTDFGLARFASADSTLTGSGAQLGSPGFMSPEQWEGSDDLDARADVFGLGATVYQALTLRLPYGSGSLSPRSAPAEPLRSRQPRLGRQYDTVTLKAIELHRRDRYPSGLELLADWRLARAGRGPRFDTIGRARRLARLARGFGVRDAFLTGVLLVLSGVVFWPRPTVVPVQGFLGPVAPAPRRVLVDCAPRRARVVLVPIDPETGLLDQARTLSSPRGVLTPFVFHKVPAGDYLVVAEVPGTNAPFEVYRHVPEVGETQEPFMDGYPTGLSMFPQSSWTERDDGVVVLPLIPTLQDTDASAMRAFPDEPLRT